MKYTALALLVLVGCGAMDDAPESEEVMENMECEWSEDVQECFCYSKVDEDGFLTWAPPNACFPQTIADDGEGK